MHACMLVRTHMRVRIYARYGIYLASLFFDSHSLTFVYALERVCKALILQMAGRHAGVYVASSTSIKRDFLVCR